MRDSQDSWMFDTKSISDHIEESETKSKQVIDFSRQSESAKSDRSMKSSAIVGNLKSLQKRNNAEVESKQSDILDLLEDLSDVKSASMNTESPREDCEYSYKKTSNMNVTQSSYSKKAVTQEEFMPKIPSPNKATKIS